MPILASTEFWLKEQPTMYTLELARANVDELLRVARKSRGCDQVPMTDRFRFTALRRLTR